MKQIFLIGYMCSGKTTLGRALGDMTGRAFVDLDDLIEERAGCTVKEIFASEGEDAFRRREREALAVAASAPGGAIIACGGGTPCFGDNMDFMNSCGTTVHLIVSDRGRLLNRLREGKAKRPLIASLADGEIEDFITRQMAAREPHYVRAMASFDTSRLEDEAEVAETAGKFIHQFLES